MKNTKMNFQNKLRSTSAILIFMLLGSFGWAQNNNLKYSKGNTPQITLEYERALNTSTSWLTGVKFYYEDFSTLNNFQQKGTRLTFEYRKYLNGKTKTLNGVYLSPNISLGKHKISYEYIPNSGIGLGTLFGIGASLVTQDASYLALSSENNEVPVRGKSKEIVSSIGVKLGYQKRWKKLTLDTGMNLSNNVVIDSKGMKVSDGSIKKYNNDLQGVEMNLYIGLGFAF